MALDAPSSAKCGYCSELYVDPRMLQCLHSFCMKCLKDLVKQGYGTILKCPKCKKPAPIPKGGINALPKDLRRSYEAEVAQYASKLQGKEAISCDQCVDVSNGPAVSFCVNCCEFLCNACTKHHKTWRKTLDHKLEPVGSSKLNPKGSPKPLANMPRKPMNCQLHEDETLKFYCETCSVLICRDCMAIEHSGHTYDRIEKVAEKEKANLLSSLRSADGAKAKLVNASTKASKVVQQIKYKQTSVEKDIRSTFNTLASNVSKREKALLSKAAEIGLGKQTALTMQGEKFSDLHKEISETCDMIMTATKVYSPAEILSAKGPMASKLQQLMKQFQGLDLEPCRNDILASSVLDMSVLVDQISSFGVVTGGSYPAEAKTDLYLLGAVAGKQKSITITTCNIQGEPFNRGGERVEVSLSLMGSNRKALPSIVLDKKDGTYVANFTPQHQGEHRLGITINGTHIKGSPFSMYVRNQRDFTMLNSHQMVFSVSDYPHDVAVDINGNIYVVLFNYHCIEVFDQTSDKIRTIGMAGSPGRGDGQFNAPSAIAVQGSVLYVAEYNNSRVQKLTTSGEFVSVLGTGQLRNPHGICIDNNGRIFVSNHGNSCVSVFEGDGSFVYNISITCDDPVNYQQCIPGYPVNYQQRILNAEVMQDPEYLNGPCGLAFDQRGNLHVVETNSGTVKVVSPQGVYITEYNSGVNHPAGIAIDDEGNIFVASNYNATVGYSGFRRRSYRESTYNQVSSSPFCVLNSEYEVVLLPEAVQSTTGIALDKDGAVYICCYNNLQVLKYTCADIYL